MTGYRTLASVSEIEYTINKSRFIGLAAPVSGEEEAVGIIADVRQRYREATHNCYAYVCNPDGNLLRFSDDGEPSGTAGKPILEVIRSNCMKNTLVVVTRYFGGILLGAGGLVRAYSHTAALAVKASGTVTMTESIRHVLLLDYQYYNKLKHYIEGSDIIRCGEVEFTESVKLTLEYKQSDEQKAEEAICSLTDGNFRTVSTEELLLPYRNNI